MTPYQDSKNEKHSQLGLNVIPSMYSLMLEIGTKRFKYSCRESIDVEIKDATDTLRLNSAGLKIRGARIESGQISETCSISLDKKAEVVVLKTKKKLRGQARILIEFDGENKDSMSGFYRSTYEYKGKREYILTSQFEPADARAAFPCFDEPAFKARFRLTMVIPAWMDALSNTEIGSSRLLKDGRKEVVFSTTKRMSTYLLYLGVGRFEYVHGSAGRTKLRVVTTRGKKMMGRLALSYASRLLEFYESYFGIQYPMNKLDLIAVPDFAAGAMENWGAITFREKELLGSADATSIAGKQRIAEVIAHELAHQWFGDLVTMEWWNDLWLNESFATFMAYKAMDSVFPEWEIMKQYFNDTIATALAADQYRATHPISVDVSTPAEINQIFDRISYDKGGSVLYMLEDYVGKETFRKGLQSYLRKYAYSNATKFNLWREIDASARKEGKQLDVLKTATAWVDMTGYPIVTAERQGSSIKVSQRRFLISGKTQNKAVWPIPLNYMENGIKARRIMFDKRSSEIMTSGSGRWIKINYGQAGFHRVRYSPELLKGLKDAIRSNEINGADSWGIENDMFAGVRIGQIKVREYLGFVAECCADVDYPLSLGISGHLGWLYGMTYGKRMHAEVKAASIKYHAEIIRKIGWRQSKGDDSTTILTRNAAIGKLGICEQSNAVRLARSVFDTYKTGRKVDPDVFGVAFAVVAWNGGSDEFEDMVGMYKKSNVPEEKSRILAALGMFRQKSLISKALRFSMSASVRMQDSFLIPAVISSNTGARDLLWKWTRGNWPLLLSRYPVGNHMLQRFVENMGMESRPEVGNEVKAFFARKGNFRDDIKQALSQTVEKITANTEFMHGNGMV
jgi:tricorn protease interacting factor F2/3